MRADRDAPAARRLLVLLQPDIRQNAGQRGVGVEIAQFGGAHDIAPDQVLVIVGGLPQHAQSARNVSREMLHEARIGE